MYEDGFCRQCHFAETAAVIKPLNENLLEHELKVHRK